LHLCEFTMAVLIAHRSVVINLEIVRRLVSGGTGTLAGWVPKGSLCSDGEVAVVRFASRPSALRFGQRLTQEGLAEADFAVVSADGRPEVQRDWLDIRQVPHEHGFLPVAMRRGSLLRLVVVPPRLDLKRAVVEGPVTHPLHEPVQFTARPDAV
jgi:hypothetical protein